MRYVQEKTRVEIRRVNIPAQFNQTKYQKSNNSEIKSDNFKMYTNIKVTLYTLKHWGNLSTITNKRKCDNTKRRIDSVANDYNKYQCNSTKT